MFVRVRILFGPSSSTQVLAGSTEPAFVDGDAADSRLNFPQSICQPDADTLLIADRSNGSVRRFDLRAGRLDAFVGRALSDADREYLLSESGPRKVLGSALAGAPLKLGGRPAT
jgi:hypothetical protein